MYILFTGRRAYSGGRGGGGSGGSRPSDNGGGGHPVPQKKGGQSPKNVSSALRASVWSNNKGGGVPGPLP